MGNYISINKTLYNTDDLNDDINIDWTLGTKNKDIELVKKQHEWKCPIIKRNCVECNLLLFFDCSSSHLYKLFSIGKSNDIPIALFIINSYKLWRIHLYIASHNINNNDSYLSIKTFLNESQYLRYHKQTKLIKKAMNKFQDQGMYQIYTRAPNKMFIDDINIYIDYTLFFQDVIRSFFDSSSDLYPLQIDVVYHIKHKQERDVYALGTAIS